MECRGIVLPKMKQPAKAIFQVMAALKNSKVSNGPTITDIVKFINGTLHKPATKRQIMTALKRTLEFGLIKRKKGRYQMSSLNEDVMEMTDTTSKKGKTIARDIPRFLDKVTKRTHGISKIRRTRPGKSTRKDHRMWNTTPSCRALYDADQ